MSLLFWILSASALLGLAGIVLTWRHWAPEYLSLEYPAPEEREPFEVRKKERGVLRRAQIGLAVVELTEEVAVLAPIPKIKRRRVIEIRGYVTNEADARALADAVTNYAPEL